MSALRIRWPKYWSFSFNISASNEHPGLISSRMDGLDLLAVQGTLKSLLQHHSSKASILWCSAFFMVQLSHLYMTPGKAIALTRQIFVGKVMPLLLYMLSRLAIAFLPRSKRKRSKSLACLCYLHKGPVTVLPAPSLSALTQAPSVLPELLPPPDESLCFSFSFLLTLHPAVTSQFSFFLVVHFLV